MSLAKTFLAIGIAIIFAVFIGYAVHVLYEPPKADIYGLIGGGGCYQQYNCQNLITDCQSKYNYTDSQYQQCYTTVSQSQEYKSCQEQLDQCTQQQQKQSGYYAYSRNTFYIFMVIGILAIILGIFLTHLEGIGSGLIGGGVLVVLWSLASSWQYWTTFPKYVKLLFLALVLFILIYFGYKKLEKKQK